MLARTKLLTFILSFVIIYSLLVTFVGRNGYMVNHKLRKYSDRLSSLVEMKQAELEMLKAEKASDGDVFLHQEESLVIAVDDGVEMIGEEGPSSAVVEDFHVFHLSYSVIFILSLILSSVLTAIISCIWKRRNHGKHYTGKE